MTALTHDLIWRGLDWLAERHGLSTSGLARKAGLNAGSFNKSKRIAPTGRPKWPTTLSLAMCLDATGESIETFVAQTVAMENLRLGLTGSVQATAPDPRDPDYSRKGVFVDHYCWRCKSGDEPCVHGEPRNCDTLHARND